MRDVAVDAGVRFYRTALIAKIESTLAGTLAQTHGQRLNQFYLHWPSVCVISTFSLPTRNHGG